MPFIPIDPERCQVDKPNGNSFMTLGGKPELERCEAKPKYVVIEKEQKNANDNFQGAMSMCSSCKDVFITQCAAQLNNYFFTEIIGENDADQD